MRAEVGSVRVGVGVVGRVGDVGGGFEVGGGTGDGGGSQRIVLDQILTRRAVDRQPGDNDRICRQLIWPGQSG